jgi:hypothetical protein
MEKSNVLPKGVSKLKACGALKELEPEFLSNVKVPTIILSQDDECYMAEENMEKE